MLYKISDVSRMVGLSVNGIRMYEDVGIVQPQRRGKYRYYSDTDITNLKTALSYRKMGMSLNDARELLKTSKQEKISKTLLECIEEIDDKIQSMQRVKEGIALRDRIIRAASSMDKSCTIGTNPHLAHISCGKTCGDDIFYTNIECCEVVSELEPEINNFVRLPIKMLKQTGDYSETVLGVCAPKDSHAEQVLSDRGLEVMEFLPTKCICTVFKVDKSEVLQKKHISHVFEYAKSHELELKDDGFVMGVITAGGGSSGPCVYCAGWFPI